MLIGLFFLLFFIHSGFAQPSPTASLVYTVQPGDTLYKLAQTYNTTVAKLVQLNKIPNPNLIYPNQQIIIITEDGPTNYFNYTVQPRDTLYRLAIRFNTNLTKLIELNKITNPDLIIIGQILTIPETLAPRPKPVYQGNLNRKQVALTFDGGGGGTYPPEQLAILKKHNVQATIFLTGNWIENFPTLAKKIAADGYEIGNHSYSHPYMTKLSDSKIKQEILKTENLIIGLGAKKPNLFRPPYGARNTHLDDLAGSLGYSSIMWSIDTIDWKNPGPQTIIAKIKNNVRNGSIILLHLDARDTIKALPEIITWLRSQGYRLVKVSEILK